MAGGRAWHSGRVSTPPPRIEDLELFLEVAERGSVTAGAHALGYPQPRASRMLQRLERDLGIMLLQRTGTGTSVTAEGALVAEWAAEIVTGFDHLLRAVESLRRPGAVRVAASQTIAEVLIPGWLGILRRELPELTVSVEVDNSAGVVRRLREHTADLGFIESADDPEDLYVRPLATDRLRLRVPRSQGTLPGQGVPRAQNVPGPDPDTGVDLAGLARLPLVVREAGSGTRQVLDHLLAPHAPVPPLVELHSNAAVRLAVATGTGPAVLSDLAWSAMSEADRAASFEVPIRGVDLTRTLRAVWVPGDRATAQIVERLAQHLPGVRAVERGT